MIKWQIFYIILRNMLKNKMKYKTIEISQETQMMLDNLREELTSIISQSNDIKLMKMIEKCSYERLIVLMSAGFSEYTFFNTLNKKFDTKEHETVFTEGARELLTKLLEEKIKEPKKNES